MAWSRLFRAVPGESVFGGGAEGLAHALKVREPAHAVLNTAAGEGCSAPLQIPPETASPVLLDTGSKHFRVAA